MELLVSRYSQNLMKHLFNLVLNWQVIFFFFFIVMLWLWLQPLRLSTMHYFFKVGIQISTVSWHVIYIDLGLASAEKLSGSVLLNQIWTFQVSTGSPTRSWSSRTISASCTEWRRRLSDSPAGSACSQTLGSQAGGMERCTGSDTAHQPPEIEDEQEMQYIRFNLVWL